MTTEGPDHPNFCATNSAGKSEAAYPEVPSTSAVSLSLSRRTKQVVVQMNSACMEPCGRCRCGRSGGHRPADEYSTSPVRTPAGVDATATSHHHAGTRPATPPTVSPPQKQFGTESFGCSPIPKPPPAREQSILLRSVAIDVWCRAFAAHQSVDTRLVRAGCPACARPARNVV